MKGVKIFDCSPKYGGFIRGTNLRVGDYPERDLMDEDEEEVMESAAAQAQGTAEKAGGKDDDDDEDEDEM